MLSPRIPTESPSEGRPLRPGMSESFPYPRRYSRGELPLAYFDSGGEGPPLVLIHGLGGNYTHFEHVVPDLAREHRVIGVDMPGCGESAKPAIRYTIDLFAAATIRLLDELAVEKAVLVGHSLGGMVVSRAMLRHPERTAALVLLNASGFWRYSRVTRLAGKLLLREKVLVPAMERFAINLLDNVFHDKNVYTRRFIAQTEGRPHQPTVSEFGRVTESLAPELVGLHFLDQLDRFLLPTLVIWGDRDKLIPASNLSRWVPRLRQGRLVMLRNCGHMPMIEQPEVVVEHIRRFVRDEVPSAEARPVEEASDGERGAAS